MGGELRQYRFIFQGDRMPQVNPRVKTYDVCIIGSGAGGGTAAKVLTEGGLDVVMLEAGPQLHPETDFKEHVWPYELAHRGADVGGKGRLQMNDEFMAPNGFWDIEGEPYTTAPGSKFRWFRSRIEGGRTNHWGRIALRFGPADFKAHSTDGMGDDWPITYEELAPYYDKVEAFYRSIRLEGECSQFARWGVSAAAQAALHRDSDQEGLRSPEHHLYSIAPGDPDQAAERTRALPLLRGMRPRLHHGFELQFQPGDDSGGAGDGAFHPDCECDGAGIGGRQRRNGRRKSRTSTRPRIANSACGRGPSSWRRAPASRRDCY